MSKRNRKKREVEKDKSLHISSGMGLVGYIYVGYGELARAFGEPRLNVMGALWSVETPHGLARICNWDEDIRPVEEIDIWHVVAETLQPYQWVKEALELKNERDSLTA